MAQELNPREVGRLGEGDFIEETHREAVRVALGQEGGMQCVDRDRDSMEPRSVSSGRWCGEGVFKDVEGVQRDPSLFSNVGCERIERRIGSRSRIGHVHLEGVSV